MKKFYIPVTWEVWDKIEVEAETLEDAVKYVKENIDEIPLGTNPEYVEDSYRIDDGGNGEESIPNTVKHLMECWNLSGDLDGKEIKRDDDSVIKERIENLNKKLIGAIVAENTDLKGPCPELEAYLKDNQDKKVELVSEYLDIMRSISNR